MIRGLDDFIKNTSKYKKNFLMNCSIYEKISAFYFHVKIVSPAIQILYKSDYHRIMTEDIIMNKMWKDPMIDIPNMFISHPDFTNKHIGWTFSFFYFPVNNPLVVEYDLNGKWKYMLGYVCDNNGNQIDINENLIDFNTNLFNDLCVPFSYKQWDSSLMTVHEKTLINEAIRENTIDGYIKLIERLVNESPKKNLLIPGRKDLSRAEGLILRNDKDIYQIVYNTSRRTVSDNRLSLEFFLHMFCCYLKETDYINLIRENYIKSVCILFNDFRNNWMTEKNNQDKFSYYNITAEDLESPTFGYYPGTCYDMIPHHSVRELCKKDKMSDNMFKILLNGLRKRRNTKSSSMLMSEEDNMIWNDCVESIKKITKPVIK